MMTYSLAGQSIANSASASSSNLPQHLRLLLREPTSVNGPPVVFQKPDSSLDTAEQQSGLDDNNQKYRLREHAFKKYEIDE